MAARCPICTTEMDDVDAVRRHTLIVHGKATAATEGGGAWSSVPGPEGQPGWQPDPWNHTALRWWDGTQWSGRTAPLASAEVAEEMAAAAGPARSGGWRGHPVPVIAGVSIGAVVLLILVLVGVVALTGGGGHHSALSGASGTGAPPQTTAGIPTAPTVSLADGVLTADDVGGGWTALRPAAALTATDYTQGPCKSPLWQNDVAGYASQLVDGGGGVVRTGEVDSQVLEAGSTDEANQQAAFVTSESFVPCVTALVQAEAPSVFQGTPLQLTQLSADPLPLETSLVSVGYVFDIGVTDPSSGLGAYITDDHIELFVNRYEGSLDIVSTSLNPMGGDLVQQETSILASRLEALPANGTTTGAAI